MMTHEFKPGDVAQLSIGDESVRAVVDHDDCWVVFDHSYFKGIRVGNDALIQDVRPLVVIDDQDHDQVRRLVTALRAEIAASPLGLLTTVTMQAALRSPVEPPRPEEPTGLGAVVVDLNDVTYVRAGRTEHGPDGFPQPDVWRAIDGPVCGDWKTWDRIAAVKVLSEGVTP